MKTRAALAIALTLLLAGCANPTGGSRLVRELNQHAEQYSLQSLPTSVQATPLGHTVVESELNNQDRIVGLDGYSSYFELFVLEHAERGKALFQLQTFCDCLGYDKRVMVPMLYFLSADGAILPTTPPERIYKKASPGVPGSLVFTTEVDLGKLKYIVVTSDNGQPDQLVTKAGFKPMVLGGTTTFFIDILNYPTGNFGLSYKKID